jgi:hypothetical protein
MADIRASSYSLILLGIAVLVFAGRIAISYVPIDRNRQPIGTDFSDLSAWLVASLAGYLAMRRAILPRPERLLIVAGFPAVFVDVGHGQSGFHTAALLGGTPRRAIPDRTSVTAGAEKIAQA